MGIDVPMTLHAPISNGFSDAPTKDIDGTLTVNLIIFSMAWDGELVEFDTPSNVINSWMSLTCFVYPGLVLSSVNNLSERLNCNTLPSIEYKPLFTRQFPITTKKLHNNGEMAILDMESSGYLFDELCK
jgi:hypothetical protein